MTGRPVDYRRRTELLDAAVDHAAAAGFSDLSWRTVAAALGVSTTTLVHHFGTKEQMLDAILDRLRRRLVALVGQRTPDGADVPATTRAIWEVSSDPRHGPMFRLFFAVYGHALQDPDRFHAFLGSAGSDLGELLLRAHGPGADRDAVHGRIILIISTLRGLLLELLGGRDPRAVHSAAESFLVGLSRSPAGAVTHVIPVAGTES